MSVTNDFFLSNGLRDLKSDNRSSQQTDRFDYPLRCSPVQAGGEDCPADAGGYYDEEECGAGK
jgi:hypothetical protein